MRLKYFTLIMFCLCATLSALAQQASTIKGVISKKLSTERVPNVLVTNLQTKDFSMSDEGGWFTMKASIGDTLLFAKADYTEQKVAIINTGDLPVYMQPVIRLSEVRIQGQSTRQELNDIMSDYRKKGTFYDGKPPVLSFLTNPLTGLYELFGKTPGEARRFATFTKGENEYAEVKRRYNVALVKRVTNASDTVAKKFMEYYTPSYEDIKSWNDYELVKHIRTSFDFYDKSDDKVGLEKLNTPSLILPEKKKATKP
jgi:hypothetical protein